MAEETGSESKRDEEQVVRDSDADTKDTERSEKTDEEQTVRDTDADTRDIDSRLDSIEQLMQRMSGTLTKLVDAQSVLVESGAVIDTTDEDPSDDDGMGSSGIDDVLDLRIDD